MIKLPKMKNLNSLNNYLLLTVSIFAFFICIRLLWAIRYGKKSGRKVCAYSLLIRTCLIPLIAMAAAGILAVIFKQNIILYPGILLGGIGFAAYFRTTFKTYLRESAETKEKAEKTEEYITKLKNRPAEELEQAQKLLQTSRVLLNRTAGLITGKKDISTEMYANIVKVFMEELDADGAVLLIADSIEETLSVKAITGKFPPPYKLPEDVVHKEDHVASNFKHASFSPDESIFGKILTQGTMKLIRTGEGSDLLPDNGSEPFLRHGSLMFFPLIANKRAVGVTAVSRSPQRHSFENPDVKIGENLAGYTSEIVNLAITLNEANESAEIENITDTAARIQKILLPKNLKKISVLDISEYFVQVRGICSDYYDVITKGNKTFIIVADVAGKSVQSAIVMVMLRALLYLITDSDKTMEEVLDTLNKGITGKIEIDHFASVSIVCYEKGKNTLEFVGAGNQSMMVWKKDAKKIELFQQKTDPIGVDANSSYTAKVIPFAKGDIAALYTDGLIETMDKDGEQYGIRRLAQVMAENAGLSSKDIAAKTKNNITAFMGETRIHDDQTLLIIKTR